MIMLVQSRTWVVSIHGRVGSSVKNVNKYAIYMQELINRAFVRPLSVKKALSVKIIGSLSPKALKCKKFGWPLSIIGLICKNVRH